MMARSLWVRGAPRRGGGRWSSSVVCRVGSAEFFFFFFFSVGWLVGLLVVEADGRNRKSYSSLSQV